VGTYTPYWNFLKADAGDFVDVESQLDRNLDIIDANGPKYFNYNFFSAAYGSIPTAGYKSGSKMYSVFNNAVYVMQGGGTAGATWVDTVVSSANAWTAIPIVAGLVATGAPDFPPEYRVDDNGGRCYLRGKLIRTANAANALGTDINVTGVSGLPNPSASIRIPEMICSGGIVTATPPYSTWYQVRVSAVGQLVMRRQGLLAQPVSAQNYIALDGFSYAL
jgi:hypothetical protein